MAIGFDMNRRSFLRLAAISAAVLVNAPVVRASEVAATCAEKAREAQALYRQGEYTNAAALYLDAVNGQDDPQMAARCRYNSGLSSFKAGDLSAASDALLPIIALPGFGNAAELYGAANFKTASDAVAATNATARPASARRAARKRKVGALSPRTRKSRRITAPASMYFLPGTSRHRRWRPGFTTRSTSAWRRRARRASSARPSGGGRRCRRRSAPAPRP